MIASKIIDDVLLRVYAGAPSADATIERNQILHWVGIVRDELVRAKLNRDIQANKYLDTIYAERVADLEMEQEDEDTIAAEEDRIFITLPKTPLTLERDMGLIKVTTNEGLPVLKASLEQLEMFRDLKYAKPSPTNLIYYRDGRKVVILGKGLYKNLSTTHFVVSYIPSYTSQQLAETQDIVLSDDLLSSLIDRVEELAMREIYTLLDKENDGVSPDGQPAA